MSKYPERPQLFAVHYIKWLIDSNTVSEAGPDAFALLVAVVMREDEVRYMRPPNFFNEQLCRHSGIGSIPALIRARNRAIDLGLLEYEPAAKRRPGRYFVSGFPNESLRKAEGIRKESGRNPTPSNPNPIPNPIPIPKESASTSDADPELVAWIELWNGLKADGLVHAGTSPKPSKGVRAGWKRVQQSAELRELLIDREAIRQAIAKSDFVREASWFKLEKLFGGTNKAGAYIVQNLLDECYAGKAEKPRTANIGAGVNFDSSKGDFKW